MPFTPSWSNDLIWRKRVTDQDSLAAAAYLSKWDFPQKPNLSNNSGSLDTY